MDVWDTSPQRSHIQARGRGRWNVRRFQSRKLENPVSVASVMLDGLFLLEPVDLVCLQMAPCAGVQQTLQLGLVRVFGYSGVRGVEGRKSLFER
uniref:Putative secreted protein n=1 Tax=Ixodes ricinus TaxID=34613 RepID=A0A0K8R5D0_IXORI